MSAFFAVAAMRDAYTDPAQLLEDADNLLWLSCHGRPRLLVFTASDSRVAREMAGHNIELDYAKPIVSNIDPARSVDPTWAGTTVVIGRRQFLENAERYLTDLEEAGNYLLVVARGERDERLPFVAFQAVKPGIEGVIIGRNMEHFGLPTTVNYGHVAPSVSVEELLAELEGNEACGGFPPAEHSGGCGGF